MSNLKSQITLLKKDFKSYEKMFAIIMLDDGNEIKVGPKDLIHALCSIGTKNEHRIVKELKGKQITRYIGAGTMPQLIMSIINSSELYQIK